MQEVLHVAADIKAAAHHLAEGIETTEKPTILFSGSTTWERVYRTTQKIAIGAVVGNDDGDILLVRDEVWSVALPDRLGGRGIFRQR